MELWIRSQNNERLIKLNDIFINANYCIADGETYGYRMFANGEFYLGHYATKERALEVLDEIQKLLKPHLIIKDNGKIIGSFEDTIIREGATYELKELSTYVYEMPKE